MRDQVDAGAGNDQLADQVDELVELVGIDTDGLAFGGTDFLDLLLLAQGGFHHFGLDRALLHQNGANGFAGVVRLGVQRHVELLRRQGAATHQHVPQSRGLTLLQPDQADVLRDAAVRRQDHQAAVVAHKFKYFFDGGFFGLGLKRHLEAEVTRLRVHLLGIGQRVGHGGNTDDLAHGVEVTDERQRVHAVAKHVGAESHRNMPVVGIGGVAVDALQVLGVCRRNTGFRPGRPGRRLGRVQVGTQGQHQGLATGLQFVITVLLACRHAVDQRANVVATGQQQHHQLVGQRDLAGAHLVEHTFHHMGKGHHMVQAEQARRTLDGVGGAKDGVDHLALVVCAFHRQQSGFHVFQKLTAFQNECFECVIQIHINSLRHRWRCAIP